MLEKIFFLAGPEAAENENRSVHAGFADLDAFTGGCHAEPVRAGFFESLGDLRTTMAIGVALDDGENFSGRLALLVSGVYVIANGAKISGESGERNFGPNGTADEIGDSDFSGCGS